MKTIEQIALSVAQEMDILWFEGKESEDGIVKQEAIDFAQKFLAAWLAQQEPVAWVLNRERCTVWWNDKFTDISQAPKKDTLLFLAPPPAVQEWIHVEDRLPEPFNASLKKPQAYLCYVPDEKNIYGGMQMILHYGNFSFIDETGDCPDADEDGEVKRFGWHYERDSEGEYDWLLFDMNGKVTHWMPLPPAPKGVEE